MLAANGAMSGKVWTCKYQRISSLCHLHSTLIVSESTFAHSKAMAPNDCRERIEISDAFIPKVCPMAVTVMRKLVVGMEVSIRFHVRSK